MSAITFKLIKNVYILNVLSYWVGQKVYLGFSIRSYDDPNDLLDNTITIFLKIYFYWIESFELNFESSWIEFETNWMLWILIGTTHINTLQGLQ